MKGLIREGGGLPALLRRTRSMTWDESLGFDQWFVEFAVRVIHPI